MLVKKLFLVVLVLVFLPSFVFAQNKEGQGGGGFQIMSNLWSLDSVNSYVSDYGFPSFGDHLIFFGGGGSGGVGRLALGGFGGGGGGTVTKGSNKADLGIGFGGFLLEYRLLRIDRLNILTSGGFGGIGANLVLIGANSAEFTLSSFLVYTGLFLRYELTEWLMLELGSDYLYAPDRNWKREAGTLDEPDPLDLSGFNVRVGLRFGGRTKEAEEP